MNNPAILADLIVILHFIYLIFTLGGETLILVGAVFKWQWVRNRIFRLIHLVAVLFVAIEALIGYVCPLTQIEYMLRRAAGQTVENEISFIGRIIRSVLFYDFPGWFFTFLYVGFGVLVAATYFLVPVAKNRRPRRDSAKPKGES